MSGTERKPEAAVSICRAGDYDFDTIFQAVGRCLELIGGLDKIIKRTDRVFVKINHLIASPPEKGIVTHPVFLQAVLEILKRCSGDITVGDDIKSDGEDGFSISGIRQACQKVGVRLINLRERGFVETVCNGSRLEKVYLSRAALEADLIVNLPRLKTHALTVFTGGIKNMYGTIPSGQRTRFHFDFVKVEDFALMLTDIFAAITPRLTIMDGIMAMEGEGPATGKLKNLGIVLASRDAVALDAVATRIIGLDPLSVFTTRYADARGLGTGRLPDISVLGDSIEGVAATGFKLPAAYNTAIIHRVAPSITRFLNKQMVIKPKVMKNLCTGCFECVGICPTGAAVENGNIAAINQSICIHCLCCNEVCRFKAIALGRTKVGNLISLIVDVIKKLI
jgi:uncharacterized protein (DUF362 family)/NAD-dependent dihydropyrimidine dehydrogenase PreA subunit